ncbi:ARL14 effector protein [Diabrotica virgifera virgifera]|uniref:ARL14 effector protein n=1 Tax=Diabrotica virgifera virgifera TaxID=50390 RepID=A0A6P7FFW5_DIAVI|nr:ARL14 effector protein [Diabrotica virgifera virgifera]
MSTESSEDEYNPSSNRENRTARKSVSQPVQAYQTRRQAARKANKLLKDLESNMTNSEIRTREKRKLTRKMSSSTTSSTTSSRRPAGALFDDSGVHIHLDVDMCDCLNEDCVGCFFECPKCQSEKCGKDCRVHRKFLVDQIEYNGYDHVIKNPLIRN